jgi:hypothetical protein
MDGGIESGFKRVTAETYRPRLIHVRKVKKDFRVSEVALTRESLNSGDCFILDSGTVVYSWTGAKSSPFEKFKTTSICQSFLNDRQGKSKLISLEEGKDDEPQFWNLIGGKGPIKTESDVTDSSLINPVKKLYRLSDSSGNLILKEVEYSKSSIDTSDVFFLDSGIELMIWIGKNTTKNEKLHSISFAEKFLNQTKRKHLPFSLMIEGKESLMFREALS